MTTASTSKMVENMRHIARHEAKPNPKPIPHTTITRGFEAFAFPKIVKELQDSNLVVKQKSLLAARELLGTPVSYMGCISAGITPAVIALLQDEDALVRERAAGTMEYIATKEVGARDIIQHVGIPPLVRQLTDEVEAVRDAAYQALIEAARFDCTRRAIVQQQTVLPMLMYLVLTEKELRPLQGLRLLNACVQMRVNLEAMTQLVTEAKAIPSLVKLISPGQPADIQEQACQLLALLASHAETAKLEAVHCGCMPHLLAILGSGPENVSITLAMAAANALANTTVVNDGKYATIAVEGGLAGLMPWLDPGRSEQLCVNVMEAVSNIAEAPESRPVFAAAGAQERLTQIREAAVFESVLERSAAQALRQCRFKCLPFTPLPGRTVVDPLDQKQ